MNTLVIIKYYSSAILYLNSDFEGGDFFFAKSVTDLMPDVRVKPRWGRLVGFSASQENLHGVLGVTKGRRCAIALWFTLDPDHKEHTFDTAENLLTILAATWETFVFYLKHLFRIGL